MTKKGAGAAATWTPSFLLLPALSRAESELFIIKKGQAKPEGCYPNRPAGGTRRGPGNHTTAVENACSLQITRTVGHPRPSSFSMKNKSNLDLRKRFPSPAASPSLRRAFPLMVGRSIRNGLRVHFVGRNDPIHSGLRGTQKRSLST